MRDALGIIYTSKDSLALRELTSMRAVAAIPIAARYRVVDFVLSSLVNSGVRNVAVIAQRNYHSLMDHLGSGSEWDLHTRNNGLFILPPFLNTESSGEYTGILDALRFNFDYLRRSTQEFVILTNSDIVLNADFDTMLREHIDSDADITMMYAKADESTRDFGSSRQHDHTYIGLNDDNDIIDMEVDPNAASYDNVLMDVVVIKRTLLIHLVDRAYSRGMKNFNADLIRSMLATGELKIKGFEYKGYWRRIETIKGYFNLSMDLLKSDVRKELFGVNPIRSKTREDVPAMYMESANVKNSIIAEGCVIAGTVENCTLFRGVRVGKGAVLRNCIIMQDNEIGENTELENVILDKAVTVRANGRLIGQKQYPIVIGKNVTL